MGVQGLTLLQLRRCGIQTAQPKEAETSGVLRQVAAALHLWNGI